jgi:pyruvate kinase
MQLKARSEVVITTRSVERKENIIPCQYTQLHKDVAAGDRILLDDGKMELKVLKVEKREIYCRVIYGGVLTDKKGINLPNSHVSSASLTTSDKKDVIFALKMGADFIALSFVRSVKDILQLKNYMKRQGSELPIIAKIEKPEALDNLDEILSESYAIMVARGDLGIEIDAAQVPMVQKDLINHARSVCKPVIVATQMMESMIVESRPTRAEVSDVSNAALNGADAVMLSGETSVGKYPIQAVKYMGHILEQLEVWQRNNPQSFNHVDMQVTTSPRRALAHAAMDICHELGLLGLFVPTSSGTTAAVVSAFRPKVPIFGICVDEQTARILMLHWGVIPVVMQTHETSNWESMAKALSRKLQLKLKGQSVAVLSGFGKRSDNNQPVLKLLKF